MARTALRLLGIQELAELLGVSAMDVKNWRRRGKLPVPASELTYGPIWTPDQFPAAVRRELLGGRGTKTTPTTSRRSGTTRKTTRPSPAKTRKSSKR